MAIPLASTAKEIFGSPAFVAAGYPGDGFWLNVGLVMRTSIKLEPFNNSMGNEAGQIIDDSVSMAWKSGMVSLTLRKHNADIIAGLIPGIIRKYNSSDTRNEAYGFSPRVQPIKPICLHIRPVHAHNTTTKNHPDVWWLPSVKFTSITDFIQKMEDNENSEEDYTIEFKNLRLFKDYTPGTRADIAEDGQLAFRGDSRHFVAESWEKHMPFGFILGTPGAPTDIKISSITTTGFSIAWKKPSADAGGNTVTGYKILHRERYSGSLFTVVDAAATDVSKAITGLAKSKQYEVRVYATSAGGDGAQSIPAFVSTPAS